MNMNMNITMKNTLIDNVIKDLNFKMILAFYKKNLPMGFDLRNDVSLSVTYLTRELTIENLKQDVRDLCESVLSSDFNDDSNSFAISHGGFTAEITAFDKNKNPSILEVQWTPLVVEATTEEYYNEISKLKEPVLV